jgi:transposase
MDACALEAITDIDTLRQMVREQRVCVAERDTRLAERDATIAANRRTLCERDALIGKLTYELKCLRRDAVRGQVRAHGRGAARAV